MKKRTLYDVLHAEYNAIGVDIDDTMISIGDTFVKYAHIFFKDRLKQKFEYQDYAWMVLEELRPMADVGITRKDVSDMLKYMESEKVIENIMPRIYCIASLRTMGDKSKIYLVTSRGDRYYNDAVGMTNRWLDNIAAYQKYHDLDKVIYDTDKVEVAKEKNIGLFFEDNPLVTERLLDAGIPVVLFNTPWNTLNVRRDKYLLTEKTYDQKIRTLEHIEKFSGTLLFRVPEWSYVFKNFVRQENWND